MINLENQLLCALLLLITAGILAFALWGVAAVRVIARWIGNRLADLGGGGPR